MAMRVPITSRAQQFMQTQDEPRGPGGTVRNAPAYPGTFSNSDQFLPSGEWSPAPQGFTFQPDQQPDPRSVLSRGQLVQANDSAGNPFRSTWSQNSVDRFKAGNWDPGPSEQEHQATLANLRAQKYGPNATGVPGMSGAGGQPFGVPPGYPAAPLTPENTGDQYQPPAGSGTNWMLGSPQAQAMFGTQQPQYLQTAQPQMQAPQGPPPGMGMNPAMFAAMFGPQMAPAPRGNGFTGGFGGSPWSNPGQEGTAGDMWGRFQHDSWNNAAQRGGVDQWDQMPSSYVRWGAGGPQLEDRPVFGSQNDPRMMAQAQQFIDSYRSQFGGGGQPQAPAAAQQQGGGDPSRRRQRIQDARQSGDMERYRMLRDRNQARRAA